MIQAILPILASAGLDLLKDVVSIGKESAVNYIEEKSGVKLKDKEVLNPEDVVKLKQFEMENSRALKELEFKYKELENKRFETSHETYRVKNDMGDVIAKQIIYSNLPVIALLVLVNVLIVWFLHDNASLIAIASNVIGLAIGNLFSERSAIVNFFFGSSIGEKTKQG